MEDTEVAPLANSPIPIEVVVAKSDALIEIWASDLLLNIHPLRETENYNKFRAAITELKSKLQ